MAVVINSAAYIGVEGMDVFVEIDIKRGLPSFNIVGLPDASVREARERVRSAVTNSGFKFPLGRITVNLAPAYIKKEGSLFDLPIAVGILVCSNQLPCSDFKDSVLIGELSLSGELKGVKGSLIAAIHAGNRGYKNLIFPFENYFECKAACNIKLIPCKRLRDVLRVKDNVNYPTEDNIEVSESYELDFEDVYGQTSLKRAIEVAAAGGHNIIIYGPAGAGKTMIAQRVPTILPKLSYEESLEVTKIYSVTGKLKSFGSLIKERPFRNPHHTTTASAMVGGGRNFTPGEITLAHKGVLYLDELPEFNKNVIDVLRQPLEERVIRLAKSGFNFVYPANFMLIGSLNPCLCGNYGSRDHKCTCTPYERKRYLQKLSKPILDRVDIFQDVPAVPYEDIKSETRGEKSKNIRERIEIAREIQNHRFIIENIKCNSEMTEAHIKKYCKLSIDAENYLSRLLNNLSISMRSYGKFIKVARTVADLRGGNIIDKLDIIEALQYRKFIDRNII